MYHTPYATDQYVRISSNRPSKTSGLSYSILEPEPEPEPDAKFYDKKPQKQKGAALFFDTIIHKFVRPYTHPITEIKLQPYNPYDNMHTQDKAVVFILVVLDRLLIPR